MVSSTSWLATTPGKRLPIPVRTTSGASTSWSGSVGAGAAKETSGGRRGPVMRPAREQATPGPDDDGAGATGAHRAAARTLRAPVTRGSRSGRDLDLAALDLVGVALDLVVDVLEE